MLCYVMLQNYERSRPLNMSAKKIYILIFHMLWVLNDSFQLDGSFEHPKHMIKLMGKITLKIALILS